MKIKLIGILISVAILSACNSSGNSHVTNPDKNVNEIDTNLRSIISKYHLTGNPFLKRNVPDISDKHAQLGMKLFFSKSLGGDRDSACVTCHHPMLGGGDALSLSVGVGADNPDLVGVGRIHDSNAEDHDGGPPVPRNAPTTFNLAAWDRVLFHDGRIESIGKTPNVNGDDGEGIRTPDTPFLEEDAVAGGNLLHAQARFPVTSKEEMRGFNHNDKDNQQIREYLASRIGGYGEGAAELQAPEYWLQQFRVAFNQPDASAESLITEQNIAFLLGEYQRSQVFANNPWSQYVAGDDYALSDSAKRGALLFYRSKSEGGASCVSCHSGDFFTDEDFYNLAMPQMGRGKEEGSDESKDFGRFRETKQEKHRFAFRTPSLLNVEVTGPWSHAGAYTTLEGVIRHHVDPVNSVFFYDFAQLTQPGIQHLDKTNNNTLEALNHLEDNKHLNDEFIEKVELTDNDIYDIVAFMKALTDPCVKSRECLSPWILDVNSDDDPNGDQLNAVDQSGSYL